MLSTLIEAIQLAREVWPKRWSNVQGRFEVEEMGMSFVCEEKSPGLLRVLVFHRSGQKIAYLEGPNQYPAEVQVGLNQEGFSNGFFEDCFQMARHDREFERTSELEHSSLYQYFRNRTVTRWEMMTEDG